MSNSVLLNKKNNGRKVFSLFKYLVLIFAFMFVGALGTQEGVKANCDIVSGSIECQDGTGVDIDDIYISANRKFACVGDCSIYGAKLKICSHGSNDSNCKEYLLHHSAYNDGISSFNIQIYTAGGVRYNKRYWSGFSYGDWEAGYYPDLNV